MKAAKRTGFKGIPKYPPKGQNVPRGIVGQRPETNGKSFHHWRTQKEKWLCEKNRLEAQQLAGRLVDVEQFGRQWDEVFIKMKQIIKSSGLPEASQVQVLGELERVLKG